MLSSRQPSTASCFRQQQRCWRCASAAPPAAATAAFPLQRCRLTAHAQPQQQQQEAGWADQQQQQQQQQQLDPQWLAAQQQRLAQLARCPACSALGRVPCKECEGRGTLTRGGYTRKNPLNMQRIQGSKWTAMSETLGWRHFRVTQTRKLGRQPHVYLLLQASCDPGAQLWVHAQNLRNRRCYAAGWLQMSEVAEGGAAGPRSAGLRCQSCSGVGAKPCSACDGTGRAALVVL